jgi:tryptophan synthase alpha chain
MLTVDMPPEEAGGLATALKEQGIDTIYLLAPTSDADRMRLVCKAATGFLYYVSFKGVTGADRLDVASVADKLQELRKHTQLPVGVGFGIRDARSAAQVAGIADAVVVGSVLVSRIAELSGQPDAIPPALSQTVAELRAAIDSVG